MKKIIPPPDYHNLSMNFKSGELVKLFQREDIRNLIQQINDTYLSWDEFIHRPIPADADREAIWALAKFSRQSIQRNITLKGLTDPKFQFSFIITDWVLKMLHHFDMNLGGKIQTSSIIPEEDKARYLVSSIMEEAIASSQLEGAATTRRVAKDMLQQGRKPKNESERMILNNYLTIRKIVKLKNERLTPTMLQDIQKTICKDTLKDEHQEGTFRDNNDVYVVDTQTGEPHYYPPDFNLLPQLIDAVCDFANNEREANERFIHPIVRACILHFLIGYIHPFNDGNGRTARALFYWYLLSNDYWLIEYMSISRTIVRMPAQYARAYQYTETDDNDLTYFLHFKLKTIQSALEDLNQYIQLKTKEKEESYKYLSIMGFNPRQTDTIREYHTNPHKTLTFRQYCERYGVSYETGRLDLLGLEQNGLISRRGKKKSLFLRTKDFDQIVQKHLSQKDEKLEV
jgi:Fic family protein